MYSQSIKSISLFYFVTSLLNSIQDFIYINKNLCWMKPRQYLLALLWPHWQWVILLCLVSKVWTTTELPVKQFKCLQEWEIIFKSDHCQKFFPEDLTSSNFTFSLHIFKVFFNWWVDLFLNLDPHLYTMTESNKRDFD